MEDVLYIQKRDGRVEPFEKKRIENAILLAFDASGEGNSPWANKITESIVEILRSKYMDSIPSVEEIQDVVEDALISFDFKKAVKKYIQHRHDRSKKRERELVQQ